ncbi:MAG: YHS domain-containing (seleno)protein [Opitutales bacterium]
MNRYYASSPRAGGTLAVLLIAFIAVFAAASQLSATPLLTPLGEKEEAQIRQKHWDLNKRSLALEGYDPVSYFEEEKPEKGAKAITATHQGVTYRFANEGNKKKFLEAPAKYEPAYGGWCAYAVVKGGKTSPDPKHYKIVDERLLLFYDAWGTDTLDLWNEWIAEGTPETELLATADKKWTSITREGS